MVADKAPCHHGSAGSPTPGRSSSTNLRQPGIDEVSRTARVTRGGAPARRRDPGQGQKVTRFTRIVTLSLVVVLTFAASVAAWAARSPAPCQYRSRGVFREVVTSVHGTDATSNVLTIIVKHNLTMQIRAQRVDAEQFLLTLLQGWMNARGVRVPPVEARYGRVPPRHGRDAPVQPADRRVPLDGEGLAAVRVRDDVGVAQALAL